MESTSRLSPNALAFIGLCNEYCHAVEMARESQQDEFVRSMLRLLPRLYISATDLNVDDRDEVYLESSMDEDFYDAIRRNIEFLMGPEDTYLEVFEEDMKYSDTPIAASISESLADIAQVCYNFIEAIKDSPEDVILDALHVIKEDFASYWSRILCNVLRALNNVRYSSSTDY